MPENTVRAPFSRGVVWTWTALPSLVMAATAIVWLMTGVRLAEITSYIAYFLIWIALPGVLLYRAAYKPERIGLDDVCVGIPLGMAAQVVGFVLLATIGHPRVGWFAAPALGLFGLFVVWRRRLPGSRLQFCRVGLAAPVLVASICLASVVLMALRDFPQHQTLHK